MSGLQIFATMYCMVAGVLSKLKISRRDTTEVLTALGLSLNMISVQKWRDIFKNIHVKYTGKTYIFLVGMEN